MAASIVQAVKNKPARILCQIVNKSEAIFAVKLCKRQMSSRDNVTMKGGRRHPVFGHLLRPGGRRVAYNSLAGKSPGVIFCPGFQSNMQGGKALSLERFCQDKGYAFTRFDYQGCGQSDGEYRDVLFSDWKDDVLAVLDSLTTGPQILVGSSIGAWLATLATLHRPDRIHALVGVAASPDFKQRTLDLLNPEAQKELKDTGETLLNSEYGQYVITRRFLDDLPQHRVLTRPKLAVNCPVRLIHGMADRSVSYEMSLRLAEKVNTSDVQVLLIKDGDHRLSSDRDKQILLDQVEHLLHQETSPEKPPLQSSL